MESQRQTPLNAEEVQALIDSRQPVLIVDARRFDEYQTMSIPGGISVPGGELALRIDGLVDSPQTPIVVNCAGRTRSIIGAQSLINAGVSNPVYALRNGTIGWTLAGLTLDRDQRAAMPMNRWLRRRVFSRSASWRQKPGGGYRPATLRRWQQQNDRTTYLLTSAVRRSTPQVTCREASAHRAASWSRDRSPRQRARSTYRLSG